MIQLFYVWNDIAVFILRIALALIFVAHGLPKLKDLKTVASNFNAMGFKPARFWATVVGLLEFCGGIFFLLGLFVQPVAFLLGIQFVVIMIWRLKTRQKLVGGFELDLILLAGLIVLAASGSSFYSLDSYFGIYIL